MLRNLSFMPTEMKPRGPGLPWTLHFWLVLYFPNMLTSTCNTDEFTQLHTGVYAWCSRPVRTDFPDFLGVGRCKETMHFHSVCTSGRNKEELKWMKKNQEENKNMDMCLKCPVYLLMIPWCYICCLVFMCTRGQSETECKTHEKRLSHKQPGLTPLLG